MDVLVGAVSGLHDVSPSGLDFMLRLIGFVVWRFIVFVFECHDVHCILPKAQQFRLQLIFGPTLGGGGYGQTSLQTRRAQDRPYSFRGNVDPFSVRVLLPGPGSDRRRRAYPIMRRIFLVLKSYP